MRSWQRDPRGWRSTLPLLVSLIAGLWTLARGTPARGAELTATATSSPASLALSRASVAGATSAALSVVRIETEVAACGGSEKPGRGRHFRRRIQRQAVLLPVSDGAGSQQTRLPESPCERDL